MKGKSLLMIIAAFGLGAGCLSLRWDEHGRALPRFPNWRLKSNAGDPHGLLRYDVVYVRVSDDKNHPGYQVIRFWPSGHYMAKLVSKLEREEVDSFTNSSVGYYQARSSEDILVEIYTTINFGQYAYIRCRLDANGDLLEISSGPSWTWWHHKYPEPLRFVPRHVGELKLQPDW